MAYGLPARGQQDWDDELNNSIEALKATADAALAASSTAVSTANYARDRADSVHTAVIGVADDTVAGWVPDTDTATGVALSTTFAGAGYTPPLTAGTTNVTTLLDAATAAGRKHIVIPNTAAMPAAGWPMTSMATIPADTWIELTPGAKLDLQMNSKAFVFGDRCRLTNFHLTSAFTGPTSAADNTDTLAAPQTYVYGARGVTLGANCIVDGDYYHENASAGLEFQGAHTTVEVARFKNIRQYQGWGSVIHAGSTGGGSSPMHHCTVGYVYAEDCDRALEIEAGASYNTFPHGHLKNIGPAGYTGQPDGSGPAGDVYADYTFVLDVHSHLGEGGGRGNRFGTWYLEDCYGGVTAVRSNGTSDADLPRDNRWDNITIAGRVGTTGYESVYVMGHDNRVNVRLQAGAGVTSKHRAYIDAGNDAQVTIEAAEAYALPLVQATSTAIDAKIKVRRIDTTPDAGTGYLIDTDAPSTEIDAVIENVTGTTGYLRVDDSAHGSRTTRLRYTVATGETMTQAIHVNGAADVDLNGIRGTNNETGVKDIATSGGVYNLRARGIINRSAVATSIDLGGATLRCDVRQLDTTLGTISDAGMHNRGGGKTLFISSVTDPAHAARIAKQSRDTPVAWGTANEGRWIKRTVEGRVSLSRFRFAVNTQAGNYYAAICDSFGKVLWKTQTTLPATGVQSLTIATPLEIRSGEEIILVIALSDATAAIAGLDLGTTGGTDQSLYARGKNTTAVGKVANLYTTNTAVGSTITLGGTHPDFIPLLESAEV